MPTPDANTERYRLSGSTSKTRPPYSPTRLGVNKETVTPVRTPFSAGSTFIG